MGKGIYMWMGSTTYGTPIGGFFVADSDELEPVLAVATLGLTVMVSHHPAGMGDNALVLRVSVTSDQIKLLSKHPEIVAEFEATTPAGFVGPDFLSSAYAAVLVGTLPADPTPPTTDPFDWDVSMFPLDVHVPADGTGDEDE